jgi:multidrug efflux pump
MMCALLLRSHADDKAKRGRGRLYLASERVFSSMLDGYRRSLDWALAHSRITLLILLVTIGFNIYLYIIVPKGFFPQQDVGRLTGMIQADQSISFQAMRGKLADFVDVVSKDPAVDNVVGFTGGGQLNSARMFIALKPIVERKISADQVIARLRGKLAHEPGANLFLQAQQDIRIGGRQSNAQYQYTLQADSIRELRQWEPRIRAELSALPELADVNTDSQDKGAQTTLVVDRDAAIRLGVTAKLIDTTLSDLFSQRQVSTIYNPLNQYRVVMEAAPEYWQSAETLKDVYLIVPNANPDIAPAQIPLSAVAHYEPTATPLSVNHQGQFVASTISFNLSPGISLSDATKIIDRAMQRIGVPISVHGSFQGTAKAFQDSLSSQPILVLTALVAVYLVLGMLYESLIQPLTILSTLPSAGVGALLALLATGTEFSVIAFIGVILLIGIVKKNAIMMIDFAIAAERNEGLSPRDAIYQACLLRFRPIMMTTMAALLGALPLAIGFSDGAEFRRPLGISIVGGLILSQLLTLYTTPVVYLYLDRLRLWRAGLRKSKRLSAAVEATALP